MTAGFYFGNLPGNLNFDELGYNEFTPLEISMEFAMKFLVCNLQRTGIRGFLNLSLLAVLSIILSSPIYPQSTDQNSPTLVTSNQIDGEIKARDIGDSRRTTYYFLFNGNRGDIFINIVTSNLNGEIDVFTLEGLRPKTKITLFADNAENETGRVIYMRKPEQLIMRVQGRTPNDDPATFQIKFAGSFEPLVARREKSDSDLPEVNTTAEGTVKVNSVGTIIENLPKAKSEKETKAELKDEVKTVESVADNKKNPKETAKDDKTESIEIDKKVVNNDVPTVFDPTKKVDEIIKEAGEKTSPRVLVTDPFEKTAKSESVKEETKPPELTVELKEKSKKTSATITIERVVEPDETAVKTEEKVDPLSKVFLKLELKDGEKFQRPMSEVLSMNVIKGVLTIVTSDGKIREISILDVAKMTVE